jgi:hypothetical protein
MIGKFSLPYQLLVGISPCALGKVLVSLHKHPKSLRASHTLAFSVYKTVISVSCSQSVRKDLLFLWLPLPSPILVHIDG